MSRRRRRKDTLGALGGPRGVGEGCVARSVPSRRGLAVARAAPSVPAILWLAAHPRRRLQAARFATRAATRTAKGSEWCVSKSVDTRQAAQRGGGLDTRAPGAQGLSAGLARERRAAAKAEQLLVDLQIVSVLNCSASSNFSWRSCPFNSSPRVWRAPPHLEGGHPLAPWRLAAPPPPRPRVPLGLGA